MSESRTRESQDFSKPLIALRTCHERMRKECDALCALLAHVQEHGSDEQARQSAASVVRYFDTAARIHHEDEEEDLLPRMMAAATISRGTSLTRLVVDIANEHREMDRAWIELRNALQGLAVGEDTLDPLDVDRFVKLYRAHITVEEANLFPLAEMLLSRHDFAEIGASMAQRRSRLRT
jgi:pyridoxamine 5'-phosphate oxidase